ncbi:MAG: hypothetical protein KF830_03840 [Planctomycetes bacterium]|nr:hypothetical protein [Planctomycetota bacterium]
MRASHRLATAFCLAAATAAGAFGITAVWSKHGWLSTAWDALALGGAGLAAAVVALAWRRLLRRPPPPGFVVRAGFVGGVGLWLAYVAVVGDYRRSRVGAALVAWAAVVAASICWAPATGRRPGRAMLGLLALALGAAAGELSLRGLAWLVPGPLWAARTAHSAQRLRLHAFQPGELHYGFPVNADGCFDAPFPPPSSQRGVVAAVVGDSFCASVVPHEFHYTTVAERELEGVAVWNVGWAGLGPPEYRYLVETIVLPRQVDAVVVALFLGNDLPETPPWTGVDRVLGDWFDRGNTLLFEVPRRVFRAWSGRGADTGLKRLGDLAAAQAWLHDPQQEPASFAEAAWLQIEGSRALAACDRSHPSLPALRHELRRLRDLCRGRRFGVVLIPDEFMVEDALWQQIVTAWPADRPVGERWGLRDRLLQFCREDGIACLDLLPLLRAVAPLADGDRHLYLRRDTHWNVRGNAIAGTALAAFLRELLAARGR